jgi:hypothetical protein
MRRAVLASLALAVFIATPAQAGTVGGGSSSAGRSSSSSSSRPSSSSSGSVKSSSSGGAKAVSASKTPGGVRITSIRQPSSGPRQQPAPAPRLVPRGLPVGARIPPGRNFVRDQAVLRRDPRFTDPYNSLYYGNPASPYFYMYLAAMQDNDPANPIPYQEARCKPKKKGVSGGVVAVLVIGTLLIAGGCGYALGRSV